MTADIRAAVLAGIDRAVSQTRDADTHSAARRPASIALDALRLLREDTEKHSPGPRKVLCGYCGAPWPCSPIVSRVRVYAPDALKEKPDA